MRIADDTRLSTVMRDMASLQKRLLSASKEASSGTRLQAPSSDPIAAAQLARVQASLDETDNFRAVVKTVRGDLELAESTLDNAHSIMDRIHEIAIQGANGSLSASERSTLGDEVRQLKNDLIGLANQRGSSGYLFGGTLDQFPPFNSGSTPSGVFGGNDQDHVVLIGPGLPMVVNVSGAQAFTVAGGRDIFADVEALANALSSNNQTAVADSVNSLDTGRRQILAARCDAGLKLDRMDTADAAHEQASLALSSQRHDVADADPTESFTRLTSVQQGLERAIGVAKTLLQSMSNIQF